MDPSMMNQAPASGVQPMGPNAGASAMPTQDPNAMVADPNTGMDPMAAGDQNTGMDMSSDDGGIDGQDIASIFDSLPDVDKDAAEGYIKYLQRKNNGEEPDPNAASDEMAMNDPNAMTAQPMMESVIFSKKQLNNVRENLCNGMMDKDEKEDKPTSHKKNRKFNSKSPFGAKRFNDKQNI